MSQSRKHRNLFINFGDYECETVVFEEDLGVDPANMIRNHSRNLLTLFIFHLVVFSEIFGIVKIDLLSRCYMPTNKDENIGVNLNCCGNSRF